jgi:hypothetical protein
LQRPPIATLHPATSCYAELIPYAEGKDIRSRRLPMRVTCTLSSSAPRNFQGVYVKLWEPVLGNFDGSRNREFAHFHIFMLRIAYVGLLKTSNT